MTDYDILYEKLKNFKKYPTVGNRIKLSKSGKRLKSLLLGIRSEVGAYNRRNKKLNPNIMENTISQEGNELYKLIGSIIKSKYPDFDFNQIIINKNSSFHIHKDKNNLNPESLIFAVGTYEKESGGGIELYNDLDVEHNNNTIHCKENKIPYNILQIKNNPTIFKGKEIYHATQDFTGERYCIVAYLNKIPLKYIPY